MAKLLIFLLKNLSYQFAFQKAKKKGILIYLKTLQTARKSLLLAFILFFTLQLMLLGFVGVSILGVWLSPIEDQMQKIWILFSFFSFLFLVPLIALVIAFSERTWLKASGAEKLLAPEMQD